MKRLLVIQGILLVFFSTAICQWEAPVIRYERSVQLNLPESGEPGASAFLNGYLALADPTLDQIYLFNTKGSLIKTESGESWSNVRFQLPVDLYAPNKLNLYVADYYNRRIIRMDGNLNYLSEIFFNDNIAYPFRIAMNRHGELYCLDRQNGEVVRFSPGGMSEQTFGGADYDKYSLIDPIDLDIISQNRVAVLDNELPGLFIYDRFGNPVKKLPDQDLKSADAIMSLNRTIFTIDFESCLIYAFSSDVSRKTALKLPVFSGTEIRSACLSDTDLMLIDADNTLWIYSFHNVQ